VHIGDCRAYLLRDGELFQITVDHPVVQSLLDEGKITPEEAASHPQRSLLLRATDGTAAELDTSLHDARAGDRYLLCSGGLTGVASTETIRDTLRGTDGPDQAAARLDAAANAGGGPGQHLLRRRRHRPPGHPADPLTRRPGPADPAAPG
jgi:PPM family protein phosphatase